jgi:hypothetical protein
MQTLLATENVQTFLNLTATTWTAIASIVSAFSLIVLGWFNLSYLRAARIQASAASDQALAANRAVEEAQDSNRIAMDAIQQQQRPWVGLSDAPGAVAVSPLRVDQDGAATVHYTVKFKNYGSTPAQSVWLSLN